MKSHLDELQEKIDEFTALILDAKEKYVRYMSKNSTKNLLVNTESFPK